VVSPTAAPSLADIDALDAATFAARLAPLFEGAPRFLARLAAARPYDSWADLFARAREIAHAMPEAEQIELVDAHPRLGAPRERVSALSFREQGYDGAPGAQPAADDPSAEDPLAATLARLNDAYESRFGFRYCVFVAGRPQAELLAGFETALAADRDTELRRALDAVVDIAAARQRTLWPDG
jgi:2-oxo-4-hydroxy-4-carboxy-5-ureidoimidazoline decarboxylase